MLNEKTQYFDTSKKILNLIPKNGIIAEIGVLRGEFSNKIKLNLSLFLKHKSVLISFTL